MTLKSQIGRNPVVVSQSTEDEIDRNFFKIILLGALGAALSIAAIYEFNLFVGTFDYEYLWISATASVGFFTILILETFFIKRSSLIMLFLFIQTAAPLALFSSFLFPRVQWSFVIGWLSFFIWSVLGARKGMRLLANALTIPFFAPARAALAKSITGLLIFLSMIVYTAYVQAGKFTDEIGQQIINDMLFSSEPILSAVFPNISFKQPTNKFLEGVAEAQLRNINLESLANAKWGKAIDKVGGGVPPKIQRELVAQASGQLLETIENMVGPINEQKPVNVVFYELAKNYVQKFPENIRNAIEILLIVLIFLTLKGVAFLLYWAVELIAFIIFKILIITGFAYINLQQRSREFIMLS